MYTSTTGIFNILDYGGPSNIPNPDGSNDASIGINLAAVAAGANGGGIVLVPPGAFRIQSPILLPDNVQLVGRDQSCSSITAMDDLQWSSTVYSTIMVTNANNTPGGTGGRQVGIGVRDITLDGNAAGQTHITSTDEAIIEMENVTGVAIQRCTIQHCYENAINVDAGPESTTPIAGDVEIVDNTIDVLATGGDTPTGGLSIRVRALGNVVIRNNVIGYNPPQGWDLINSGDGIDVLHCDDVVVSGNQVANVQDGIVCDWGEDCVISDNIVDAFVGYGIRSDRISSSGNAVTRLVIANNVVNALPPAEGAASSEAGIEASGGFPSTGSGPPTSNHFSVGGNTVKGPFTLAGVICSASNGSCTGNAIDMCANGLVQVGLQVKGSYMAVTGNQIFDSIQDEIDPPPSTGTGLDISIDANDSTTQLTDIVVDGNGVIQGTVGMRIDCSVKNVSITNNNLVDDTTPFVLGSSAATSNCRVAGNLNWNPPAPSSITQPSAPGASPQQNSFLYDCMVSVKGTSITSITVDGQSIPWPSGTIIGPIIVYVPVNGSLLVGGSGLAWYWTPQ